jgi:ribA/ribD-fused uncharacterized protein
MADEIKEFKDEYRWLSNFYPSKIKFLGVEFPTVEHAYQASKTSDEDIHKYIATLSTPGKAKRYGRTIQMNKSSEMAREITMYWLVCQKFKYPELRKKLMETGYRNIIEGNYWHDNFWGRCFCKRCEKIDSENILGRIIMTVRDEIRKGYHKDVYDTN